MSSKLHVVAATVVAASLMPLALVGVANAAGELDPSFANPAATSGPVYSVQVRSDGKIMAGGGFTTIGGVARDNVARLNSDGSLDAAFANPLVYFVIGSTVYSLAASTDGKVAIGGVFTSVGGVARNDTARINPDGSLDSSFVPNVNDTVLTVAVQSDGKVLVGGEFTTVGGATRRGIARLNSNGALDSGFNANLTGQSEFGTALALQADGKILLGGEFEQAGGIARRGLARLNSDGTGDSGFNANLSGGAPKDIFVEGNGKVVIGGRFTAVGGVARDGVARLNSDGSLDAAFVPPAVTDGLDGGSITAVAAQPDGKVVIGGQFTAVGGVARDGVARLNSDGSLDTSFVDSNLGIVRDLAIQNDGNIVVAGGGVFRLLGAGTPPTPTPSPPPSPSPAPSPAPSPSPTPAGPSRPSAKIAVKGRTVTASLTPIPGVSYAISASQSKKASASAKTKTAKGKCKPNKKTKKVDCSVKLSKGTWTVAITPKKDGVSGTPLTKKVQIKK